MAKGFIMHKDPSIFYFSCATQWVSQEKTQKNEEETLQKP
jgi:hypothetical protein